MTKYAFTTLTLEALDAISGGSNGIAGDEWSNLSDEQRAGVLQRSQQRGEVAPAPAPSVTSSGWSRLSDAQRAGVMERAALRRPLLGE